MMIIFADEAFMAERRRDYLPAGWWIVDLKLNFFFAGPFDSRDAAFERYDGLPEHLKDMDPLNEA